MHGRKKSIVITGLAIASLAAGCAAPNVDFSKLERPPRAPELDAFNIFVGKWDWQADATNADEANRHWTGQAEWMWTLDRRCLHGTMSARSADSGFDAAGVWTWHPTQKTYMWWMFNNWGYPQEGTARYDEHAKSWTMPYTSVGLDGTTSHGEYKVRVVDTDNIEWNMIEWADALHSIKKMEMTGTYKRRG